MALAENPTRYRLRTAGRVDLDAYQADVWANFAKVLTQYRPPLTVQANASCRGEDTTLWFPTRKGVVRAKAAAICASCPVAGECRSWAYRQGPGLEGTWGGTSPDDRR